NLQDAMQKPYGVMLLAGAVISIFFGFIIPTGKVIVGLGLIRFVMPVSLVLCVNTGIFISGLALLKHVMSLSNLTLILIAVVVLSFLGFVYSRRRKLNTVAVLIGAFGYLMIYSSLITLSVQKGLIASVIMYGMAILLFVMLCGIGIKADLKNPKVHWVIEISNVICQGLVALATVLLFGK
ncbi:MAG: hypothetical protein II712_00390, partial [Erysipelotrichaceae bacterium]|nr:hypothetical protein [Erysipelotrichaceae bacterium]